MSHQALSPQQFHYQRMDESHSLYMPAHDDPKRQEAGMEWDANTGDILGIEVRIRSQRQGIATAMYKHAHKLAAADPTIRPPRHSSDRSDEGEAWARSLGEELPHRVRL